MDLYQRGFLRRASVAVRRHHGHGFLERQNVVHLCVIRQRIQEALFYGAGVTKHIADPVRQELLDDRESTGFHTHSWCYHPYRRRPFSSTWTINSPTRCESCVERPVRKG